MRKSKVGKKMARIVYIIYMYVQFYQLVILKEQVALRMTIRNLMKCIVDFQWRSYAMIVVHA